MIRITLKSLPSTVRTARLFNVPEPQRLKLLLKYALRTCGFRCVSVETVVDEATEDRSVMNISTDMLFLGAIILAAPIVKQAAEGDTECIEAVKSCKVVHDCISLAAMFAAELGEQIERAERTREAQATLDKSKR